MTARTIPANRTRNAGRLALDLGMFAALLLHNFAPSLSIQRCIYHNQGTDQIRECIPCCYRNDTAQ